MLATAVEFPLFGHNAVDILRSAGMAAATLQGSKLGRATFLLGGW